MVPEESAHHLVVDARRPRPLDRLEALLGRVALAAVGDEDAVEGLVLGVRQLVHPHLVDPHLRIKCGNDFT